MLQAGKFDQRIKFERLTNVTDTDYGGSAQQWIEVATVWAQIQDVLPSRAESVQHAVNIASRPARIRIHWRAGLNSSMRITVLCASPRVLQIVSGPAELGNREAMEFMAEEFSP